MNKLKTNTFSFTDFNHAGFIAKDMLEKMTLKNAGLEGRLNAFLERIFALSDAKNILKEENCKNLGKSLIELNDNYENLLEIYSECSIFFDKVAKFEEMPSSFHHIDLQGEYINQLENIKKIYENASFEEVKNQLLKSVGSEVDFMQEIKQLRSVWLDQNSEIVCSAVKKAQENYNNAIETFQNEVEEIYATIENKTQSSENQHQAEMQQTKHFENLKEKVLTNKENGKTYLIVDDELSK